MPLPPRKTFPSPPLGPGKALLRLPLSPLNPPPLPHPRQRPKRLPLLKTPLPLRPPRRLRQLPLRLRLRQPPRLPRMPRPPRKTFPPPPPRPDKALLRLPERRFREMLRSPRPGSAFHHLMNAVMKNGCSFAEHPFFGVVFASAGKAPCAAALPERAARVSAASGRLPEA